MFALLCCNGSLLGPRVSIGLLAIASACATAGCAGWPHGHNLSGAPYYKSFANTIHPQEGNVGHLPVVLDSDVMPSFPRDRLDALQPLLDEIDSYLDSLGWSARLGASSLPAKGAPVVDVRSSEEQHGGHERASASDDQPPVMQLWITKPAAGWRDTLTQIAEGANIEYVLYLALGFSEYSIRMKGVFSKGARIGHRLQNANWLDQRYR